MNQLRFYSFATLISFLSLTLTVLPGYSLAADVESSRLVLPRYWKLDPNNSLVKNATGIRYHFVGSKENGIEPSEVFTFSFDQRASGQDKMADPKYLVTGCDALKGNKKIFSSFIGALKFSGFSCLDSASGRSTYAIVFIEYLSKHQQALVMVWRDSENFTERDFLIRAGYSLQSALNFLICRAAGKVCNGPGSPEIVEEQKYLNRIFSSYFPQSQRKENPFNDRDFIEDFYNLHLAAFGFVPHLNEGEAKKCVAFKAIPTLRRCEIKQSTRNISATSPKEFSVIDKKSPLIKIVLERDAEKKTISCSSGDFQVVLANSRKIGASNRQEWFICKKDGNIIEVISKAWLKDGAKEYGAIHYHWFISSLKRNEFEKVRSYLEDELAIEILKIQFCNDERYLNSCASDRNH